MIAQQQKQWSGAAQLSEVVSLRKILPGGVLAAVVLLGHERVAEIHTKIGCIGQRVG